MLNKKDYWIVEFNEGGGDIKNYKGLELTETLLDEFKKLDEELYLNHEGYYKFYFDNYVDGVKKAHIRLDIGSGFRNNEFYYDNIAMDLVESKINNGEIIVDENKVVNEDDFINAVINLKLALYKLDKNIEVSYTDRPVIRLVAKNVDGEHYGEVAALVDNFKYQNYLLNI